MRIPLFLGMVLFLGFGLRSNAQSGKSIILVLNETNETIPYAKIKNVNRNVFCFADAQGKLRYDTLFARIGDTLEVSSLNYHAKPCIASGDSSGIRLSEITETPAQFAASQNFPKASNTGNQCKEKLPLIFMPGQVVCFRLPVDQFSMYITDIELNAAMEFDSIRVKVSVQDPAAKPGVAYVGRTKIMYLKKTGELKAQLEHIDLLSATATKQHWIIIEFLPIPTSNYKLVWTGCHKSSMPQYHPKIKGHLGIGTIRDEWYNRTNWYPSFTVGYKHN